MSTRSVIALQKGEDEYEAIYCHYDGYLTHNGEILINYYNTKEKVEKLLKLGDLSSLDIEIDPDPNFPHSFDGERQDNVCVAYGRDRGEEGTESRTFNLDELLKWDWIEYFYIYDLNGNWKYYDCGDLTEIRDVKEDLEAEYREIEKEKQAKSKKYQDTEM